MLNMKPDVTYENIEDVTQRLIIFTDILNHNTALMYTINFNKAFVKSDKNNHQPIVTNRTSIQYTRDIVKNGLGQSAEIKILSIPMEEMIDQFANTINKIIVEGDKLFNRYLNEDLNNLDFDVDDKIEALNNAMDIAKLAVKKYETAKKYIKDNWE